MNINGKWYSETELAAYVKELEARISELEDKHFSECGQVAHYSDENAKMKELLRKAVEDFRWLESHTEDGKGHCCISGDNKELACIRCPLNQRNKDTIMCGWNYEDQALALIGGGKDETK